MDRRLLIIGLMALGTPGLANANAEKGERKKGGGLTFIQFPTLSVTVRRRDGRRGVLTVELGLDVPDQGLHDNAQSVMPRMRAGFLQTLQVYGASLNPGSLPNAEYLAREFQRQTDQMLGRPGAKLLLGTILVS